MSAAVAVGERARVQRDVGARRRQRDRHRRRRARATRRSRAPPCRRAETDRATCAIPFSGAAGGRKSSRIGEKMSMSTTSSSSIVAPCGMCDGKCSTSPAEAMRSWPSMVKRTRPRSTIVICSCGCECTAVTTRGSKRSRQIISRSPQIIWRSMPSAMCSTGIVGPVAVLKGEDGIAARHFFSARPLSRPEPMAANSGCTLTTPYWRSTSSRLAAIIQRKLIAPPGAATFG